MKILILILTCKQPLYLELENTIDLTWNSLEHPNIKTYYYYGGHKQAYHDDRNIYLKTLEDYYQISLRTIECFEYCLNYFDFDFILRTNNSSYINKKLFYQFTENLPNKFYGGVIGRHGDISFASGAGMLISKSNIEYLIKNKKNINYELMDDVAIATILNNNNIITPINRYTFDCNTNLPPDHIFDTTYHFRCKCEYDRNIDSIIMKKIHNYIINNISL